MTAASCTVVREQHTGELAVCADFGSTFTKVTVVDLAAGRLVATASHPTTLDSDVMDGLDAAVDALSRELPGADLGGVVACSSAGGGLRLAVVGYERAVTAEAGHRVGLSAGARVAYVSAGWLEPVSVAGLVAARPDVVLLVGGTDGGNTEVLLHNAREVARSGLTVPVVVAGNVEAGDQVRRVLRRRRIPVVSTANVLPRIGVLAPRPAREAIREVFIEHVIGGKHLSRRTDLARYVKAATPDAVLAGVELLADGAAGVDGAGDVVVVDVGGATTDVYSVVTPDPDDPSAHRDVVETLWRARTVEGDLGVRWNAPGVLDAAVAERLLDPEFAARLRDAAARRAADPGFLPDDPTERAVDAALARLAAVVALRRHARPHESGGVRHPGRDLRRARLVVGSGGVLRHGGPGAAGQVLAAVAGDTAGGWRTPERARLAVDRWYVLAAAGLLADAHPWAAASLVAGDLPVAGPDT